jgi:hypothetical protein
MPVMQLLKSAFKEHAPESLVNQARSAFHIINRRVLHEDQYLAMPNAREQQFDRLASKLQGKQRPVICVIGDRKSVKLPDGATQIYADFDIRSPENLVDQLTRERIDAFLLETISARDLVNVVNLVSVYGLDVPILMGGQLDCHSLISYVPLLPKERVATSVSVHNYFARNYRISDTILFQGYVYQGTRLVDCHQFLLKPEETKVFQLDRELDIEFGDTGMYFLEAFHPQLPTSTPELRYFGLYQDRSSGFMAGTHAIPLGNWSTHLMQRRTSTRTFIPNLNGVTVSYATPGCSVSPQGSQINAPTTLGNEMVFSPTEQGGALNAVTGSTDSESSHHDLEFDRLSTGLPIFGSNGFQTLWRAGNGLAVWHDGNSVRGLGKRNSRIAVKTKERGIEAGGAQDRGNVLAEERQESDTIPNRLLDLYQSRAKYFAGVFPFLGHSHPDLHVVFDCEQWSEDIVNFDIGLYTNTGSLVSTQPLRFNGSLQTVNLNRLFAGYVAELDQGYWRITADARNQGIDFDLADLQYPSGSMLFGFWSDGAKLYDSVHSLESRNAVGYNMGMEGLSEAARATNRIVSRTKKFAPFYAGEDRKSWYWICNVGRSEELIDANVKIRVFGSDGQEGLSYFTLPAGCARIVSSEDVLKECGINHTQGTLWIEANECNLGAMWFLQAGQGNGFATDHFTGG